MYCCENCGVEAPLGYVHFKKNIGMMFVRQEEEVAGNFCKNCIRSLYKDFQTGNWLGGWWGTISAIITPVYIIHNMGEKKRVKGLSEVPHGAIVPYINEQLWDHLRQFLPTIEQMFNEGVPPWKIVSHISAESGCTPGTVDLFLSEIRRRANRQQLQQNMQARVQNRAAAALEGKPARRNPNAGKQVRMPARRPRQM